MLRRIIALFLLSIFISYSALPTIISLVDKDVDITFLIDLNEEESKEKESSKDAEIKILDINDSNGLFNDNKSLALEGYHFKKYATPHLNLISPPPDHNI